MNSIFPKLTPTALYRVNQSYLLFKSVFCHFQETVASSIMDASIPKKPPDQLVKEINVLLLKNCDFRGEDGEVFMPTDGERSTLKRRPHLGQYKSKVEFHASMSEDMVKKKLQEIFPYLKSRR